MRVGQGALFAQVGAGEDGGQGAQVAQVCVGEDGGQGAQIAPVGAGGDECWWRRSPSTTMPHWNQQTLVRIKTMEPEHSVVS